MADLVDVVESLVKAHGVPEPPYVTDPFEMIVFENVSYLVSDEYRIRAFENLRAVVGLTPDDILAATADQWDLIAPFGGSNKRGQIAKLIEAAEIVRRDLDGDMTQVLKLPFKKAVAALKRFPGIGEPAAEKILLFAGAAKVFPPESNGLRVMARIGLIAELASYTAMYRAAQKVASEQAPSDTVWLITAYQRLRKHGQLICRRADPGCNTCAVRSMCDYGRSAII